MGFNAHPTDSVQRRAMRPRLHMRKFDMDLDGKVCKEVERATFALGCFWGPEARFGAIPGVLRTRVGYAGGTTSAPTYEQLGDHMVPCSRSSGIATTRSIARFEGNTPRRSSTTARNKRRSPENHWRANSARGDGASLPERSTPSCSVTRRCTRRKGIIRSTACGSSACYCASSRMPTASRSLSTRSSRQSSTHISPGTRTRCPRSSRLASRARRSLFLFV